MKKILILFLCFYISSCSVPTAANYRQLYSFTREEKKLKGVIGKKKVVLIKDFRENDMYEEDMEGLKQEVEEYILAHPDLGEQAKLNLRELKVTEGARKEEVRLLLDKPDKVVRARGKANYAADEIWIYKISKLRTFTVFIIPVFLCHEGYYLYFKDDLLAGIERHYLTQIVQQGSAPGVIPSREKTTP